LKYGFLSNIYRKTMVGYDHLAAWTLIIYDIAHI